VTLLIAALMATFAQDAVPLRAVDSGIVSQIDEREEAAVRTAAEWRALWARHAPDAALPAVDFDQETVVAVFLGTRPTAGYGVQIVEAVRGAGGELTVRFRERRPAGDAITAQVITSPFAIVALPRTAAPIRFERIG
jgi:hypothetical protein